MKYVVEILDQILVVRYIGIVDGLLVMEHIRDRKFYNNLKLGKVIYDYSETTQVRITREDFLSFARLAASQQHFIPAIDSAIVINDNIKEHAIAYKAEIEAKTGWKVILADSLEEALVALA